MRIFEISNVNIRAIIRYSIFASRSNLFPEIFEVFDIREYRLYLSALRSKFIILAFKVVGDRLKSNAPARVSCSASASGLPLVIAVS